MKKKKMKKKRMKKKRNNKIKYKIKKLYLKITLSN